MGRRCLLDCLPCGSTPQASCQTVGRQKEEFARYEEECTRRRILREFSVGQPKVSLDPARVIEVLQREEARQPGSVMIDTPDIDRESILHQEPF
jgi:hypothetical protein